MASPPNRSVPSITLKDGNSVPAVGLGVWQTPAGNTERAVTTAPDAGQDSRLHDAYVVPKADTHGRTAAQGLIRWHVQLGNIVIPKSVNPESTVSNVVDFDFEPSTSLPSVRWTTEHDWVSTHERSTSQGR